MSRLIKSFFFKLSKDIAFRITLIIGVGLAIMMTGLFLLIDISLGLFGEEGAKLLTGPNMLLSSLSPVDNFGLAIPINLITFICLEFSQGTIRNKIIAGHSKFKIYLALFISGLVLAFSLLFVYVGLCTLLGTIFGGFDLNNPIINMTSISSMLGAGYCDAGYILQMLLVAVVVYANIVAFTIFFSALFRTVGPCIPIVIIALMIISVGGSLVSMMGDAFENDALVNVVTVIDPLYVISGGGTDTILKIVDNEEVPRAYVGITNFAFVSTLVNNLVYAALFFFGGAFIFAKRDVK